MASQRTNCPDCPPVLYIDRERPSSQIEGSEQERDKSLKVLASSTYI